MAHISGKRDNPVEPWVNPYQLLQKMQSENIEYGYYDFKNKARITYDSELFNDNKYIEENCYVLHPREVWKYKIGTCWDCAMMEWYWCKRIPNINPHVLFLEFYDVDINEKSNHTVLYYRDTMFDKWYMMEYSWYIYRGFFGPYNSRKELFENYINNIIYKSYKNINCVNIDVDINSIYKMPKITLNDFYALCKNFSEYLNEKFWNNV